MVNAVRGFILIKPMTFSPREAGKSVIMKIRGNKVLRNLKLPFASDNHQRRSLDPAHSTLIHIQYLSKWITQYLHNGIVTTLRRPFYSEEKICIIKTCFVK